jgi:hypothetical protein
MKIRRLAHNDIEYCVNAARKFCEIKERPFDEEHSRSFITATIYNGHALVALDSNGKPTGHSAALVFPDMYSPRLTARVFTTWGKGGLKCFEYLLSVLKMQGVKEVIADCWDGDERLSNYYKKKGFDKSYEFYTKEI